MAEGEPHMFRMHTGTASVSTAANKGAGAGERLQLPLHQRLPGMHSEHEL